MEKGSNVDLICIDEIDSTHTFLCENVRSGKIDSNLAVYALVQTNGVGSRDNVWQSQKGNLHLSFCIKKKDLSPDLPLASVSIYFAFLLKDLLAKQGSQVWLKWPNDLYVGDKKVGGIISASIKDFLICGVGLNLVYAPENANVLDIKPDLKGLIQEFIKEIQKKILWKQIFRKYMLEFEKSKKYSVHYQGKIVSLQNALLYEDGSILLENKRVYSLR